jgi:2-amino-4-hydroxy-6-hydroxymethyldihydropteridine diphosphokinase
MMVAKVTAYIGIGSNLGDAKSNVQRAILLLDKVPLTTLHEQSSLFRTAPVDADGDDYINAVASVKTELPAQELLEALQALELQFGRERPYLHAPRTLDLDLLLYGSEIIDTETLTVPHPGLSLRAFALIPLLQLDPFITIPGKGPAHAFAPDVANQVIQKI